MASFPSVSETYAKSRPRQSNKAEENEGLLKKSKKRSDPSKMERDATTSSMEEFTVEGLGRGTEISKSLEGRRSSGARVLQAPKRRKALRKNKVRWVIKGIIGFLALLILSKLAMKMCCDDKLDAKAHIHHAAKTHSHHKLLNTNKKAPEFAEAVHERGDHTDHVHVDGDSDESSEMPSQKVPAPKKVEKEVRRAALKSGAKPVVVAPDDVQVSFDRWDGQQGQTSMKYALEDDNAALMSAMFNLKDETKTPKEEGRASSGDDLLESVV